MNKIKLILTVALTFVALFAQAGNVAAAPLAQDPALITITGTIQSIIPETDASGVTTVLVTLLLDDGITTQTVRISVETAASLGLLMLDPITGLPILDPITNLPVPDLTKIGTIVIIDSATIIPDVVVPVHPISDLLAGFFGEDASIIDGYHNNGFGFGVIAQALWMSQNITGTDGVVGDASLAGEILDAKKNKDFETFFAAHPEYFEGEVAPTNWGQFRKALLNKKNNLGVVVSGHTDEDSVQKEHGNGNGKQNDNDNGNGNGHGNDKTKNKGKDN